MILLVTGGRLYSMQPYDWLRLDALGATALYEGEADGADLCALGWATSRGIPVRRFPADWDAHGKAAGPVRNAGMLEAAREEAQQTGQPLLVAALPGGSGTADMVRRADAPRGSWPLVVVLDWRHFVADAERQRNAEASMQAAGRSLPAPHWSAYRHLRAPRHAGAVHAGTR